MAGAVSAGAYTAGVMDYLLEALDEWQLRKDSGQANVPLHNVEISALGGASAGGMTGIITAAALSEVISPVRNAPADMLTEIPDNKLYHSWVDLVSQNMLNVMLSTDDFKNGFQSGLNSDFIDIVAERAITVKGAATNERKYIAKNLRLFVTLSNLNGMDFSVMFKSSTPKLDQYIITSHNDYACFMLAEDENDYKSDGFMPLNFRKKINSDVAKTAAMATGAFPVGLKARIITRNAKYLNDLAWFKYITQDAKNPFKGAEYTTINVDGGLINNEPFEQLRKLLIVETQQDNPEEYENYNFFKSTILMIDPFPSERGIFKGTTALSSVVGNTLAAMIDQARIKPATLINTMDSNNAGQFLVSPVRYANNKSIEGPLAIACGSLDGFGGFISKEFRVHDYFLGRANCEKFLRDHFTIPAATTNPVFTNGYVSVADRTQFTSQTDGGLQIIPIFTSRQPQPYMPVFSNEKQFPSVTSDFITSYRRMIKKRVEKILMNASDLNTIQRALMWVGAQVVLNGKITDTVLKTILEALEKHQLLDNK